MREKLEEDEFTVIEGVSALPFVSRSRDSHLSCVHAQSRESSAERRSGEVTEEGRLSRVRILMNGLMTPDT